MVRSIPSVPDPTMTLEAALDQAYRERADYKAALERLRAAEECGARPLRSVCRPYRVTSDFGTIGLTIDSALPTFNVTGVVDVPIFDGGHQRARLGQADADLKRQLAQVADLKAQVYYDVRTAFLDLQTSQELMQTATRSRELAAQQLEQSRDRFAAGVANNIEVVQAQEAVALATDQFISAVYGFNIAKAMLLQSVGTAEDAVRKYSEVPRHEQAGSPHHRGRRRSGHRHRRMALADRGRESTDDAQVEAHLTPIAARVGGTVLSVPAPDNQQVEAGALLVQIDPRDFEVALARAEAELANAEAELAVARANVPITSATANSNVSTAQGGVAHAEAGVTEAEQDLEAAKARLVTAQARLREQEANATKATRDVERLRPLLAKEEISQQQFDAATADAEARRASADSAQAQVQEAQVAIRVAQSRLAQSHAGRDQATAGLRQAETAPEQVNAIRARAASAEARVKQAQAAVKQAQFNLDYTTVKSPVKGVVSQKSVELGQVVQPGQPLMAVIALDRVLDHRQLQGDAARATCGPASASTIDVDAYGGRTFAGSRQHRRRRPARASACCRRTTPPATTSRSSSACP